MAAEETIDRINSSSVAAGMMKEESATRYMNRLRRLAGVEAQRGDPLAAAAAMGIKVTRSTKPSPRKSS